MLKNLTVIQNIPLTRISDMLCSAFDPGYGSSYYWAELRTKVAPTAWEYEDELRPEEGHWLHEYPLSPDGALILSVKSEKRTEEARAEEEAKRYTLDLEAIKKGMQVFADKNPRHYANFMAEQDDGETADVFVQCCIFGEIIYG